MIAPRNFLVILIATISVSVVILLNSNYENEDFDNFTFDAVYLKDSNSVLITFDDTTQKSSFAILEMFRVHITPFHKQERRLHSTLSDPAMPKTTSTH